MPIPNEAIAKMFDLCGWFEYPHIILTQRHKDTKVAES